MLLQAPGLVVTWKNRDCMKDMRRIATKGVYPFETVAFILSEWDKGVLEDATLNEEEVDEEGNPVPLYTNSDDYKECASFFLYPFIN